jgi:hypothetical protein
MIDQTTFLRGANRGNPNRMYVIPVPVRRCLLPRRVCDPPAHPPTASASHIDRACPLVAVDDRRVGWLEHEIVDKLGEHDALPVSPPFLPGASSLSLYLSISCR